MENKSSGHLILMMSADIGALDKSIVRHMAQEIRSVLADGVWDLDEYGEGNAWNVEVIVEVTRKEEE